MEGYPVDRGDKTKYNFKKEISLKNEIWKD